MQWTIALVFVGLSVVPVLFLPTWIKYWVIVYTCVSLLWNYLTWESSVARGLHLRPLTSWDISDLAGFKDRLREAGQSLRIKGHPVLTVVASKAPTAVAVTGRRGLIIFSTSLLKHLSPEEVLAVAGHELHHIAARDGLPAMVGLAVFRALGWLVFAGHFIPLVNLLAAVANLLLIALSFVAVAVLAQRSRLQEHEADLAGARLTSADVMISALNKVYAESKAQFGEYQFPTWSPAWIVERLHASHPQLEARIKYLRDAEQRGELRAS